MKPVFVAACVLPAFQLINCFISAARKLPTCFEWLLDWEPGKRWPVLAAILPALIPIAKGLEENAPLAVKGSTVAGLLLAVAVLQLYGQERNNRDRIKTEARFTDLLDEIRQGRVEVNQLGARVSEQAIDIRRIADGIAALAAQAEEEEA